MNKKLLLVILAITLVVVAGVSLFYYRNNGKFTIAWKSPLIEREDWQPIADKTNDKEIKPSTKFTSHYEPVNYSGTEVEYPGSPTNVTLPTIPSNQSLMPPPYHPFDRFPEPGAKDVPLYTHISVSFPRP
ncbi:MAG: hypothetical protein U9O85_08500, partial [Euryarchaeota archaeon]|nr:hypothetical protein [Euryarchaeota archaeon]